MNDSQKMEQFWVMSVARILAALETEQLYQVLDFVGVGSIVDVAIRLVRVEGIREESDVRAWIVESIG